MNKYKTLLGNIGLFGLNVFATKIISFVLVPLYTYYLNTADFGIQDMATLVISMLSSLATLCIADGVLRFMIDDKRNARGYATAGLIVMIAGCFVVMGLLPVTDLPIFGGLGNYKWLFLMFYAVGCFQNLFSMMARALNRLKVITYASIASSLVTAIGSGLFIAFLHMGLTGFFYASILGGAVGALIYFFAGHLQSEFVWHDSNLLRLCLKRMLPYSLPLIPNNILWLLNTSVNRFFITGFLGISASGMFAAASKIPNLLMIAYSVFQQAWTLSAFQEYRQEGLGVFYSKVYRLLDALLCIGASAIIMLSEPLARLLLQKEFFNSWPLIPLLIAGLYFNIIGSFWGSIYTTFMKTREIMTTTFAAAAVSIVLTWGLIHVCQLAGVAVALLVSNVVLWLTRVFSSRRLLIFKVNWGVSLLTYALIAIQIALGMSHVHGYLPMSFALFIVVSCIQLWNIRPMMKQFANIARQLIPNQRH